MDLEETAAICALIVQGRKKKERKNARKYWVHPIYSARLSKGKFHVLYGDLREHPKKFFSYFRMNVSTFDELIATVGPHVTYQNTNFRLCVSAEERIAVTLRYLSTGISFNSLSFEYLIAPSTLRMIVEDCCKKIWKHLQPLYMPGTLREEDWVRIADKFYERTNFPNVIGAVDGKHIRLVKPDKTGSKYYNYKKYFSQVLMAWVDADYKFVFIDVGSLGAMSDSVLFKNSKMGQMLENNTLNIPKGRPLPGDERGRVMPFYVLGDDAFGLSEHVIRPYSKKNLSVPKRIFNYRHCRGRRLVECTFGILANKWRILHRPLDVSEQFCDAIIKCCCILHNYLRVKDGIQFSDTLYDNGFDSANFVSSQNTGSDVRQYLSNYFTTPAGSIPWQYSKI